MSEQNKIPTNEELVKMGWEYWNGTKSQLLDFIHDVRAAGRKEQREKDAEIAESYSPGRTDPAKRDLCYDIAGAIRSPSHRAQGEEEE